MCGRCFSQAVRIIFYFFFKRRKLYNFCSAPLTRGLSGNAPLIMSTSFVLIWPTAANIEILCHGHGLHGCNTRKCASQQAEVRSAILTTFTKREEFSNLWSSLRQVWEGGNYLHELINSHNYVSHRLNQLIIHVKKSCSEIRCT